MRGKKESWARAMQALKYVQEAGMDPYLNVTVGHYNAKSEDLALLQIFVFLNIPTLEPNSQYVQIKIFSTGPRI